MISEKVQSPELSSKASPTAPVFPSFWGTFHPGKGPGLHRHPYAETCIVLSGQAAMIVNGEEIVASAGDIVVIAPATPYRFTAIGDERLDMVCVHASERFVIESLKT